ncbi:UNVERIFIED_CONTAM: hypothetical protein O8I53_11370 [Campylobacter lari]
MSDNIEIPSITSMIQKLKEEFEKKSKEVLVPNNRVALTHLEQIKLDKNNPNARKYQKGRAESTNLGV